MSEIKALWHLERFPLRLGAWDGLRYVLWHSVGLPYNYFRQPLIEERFVHLTSLHEEYS